MKRIAPRRIEITRLKARALWTSAALLWVFFITTQQFAPTDTWLLDWHVYAAGARDFLDGTLYSTPLESAYHLPISEFNLPPLSAIAVIPLLLLPDAAAGTAWVGLNILAVAVTAVLVARILRARQPMIWGGIGFLAYTIHPWMDLAFLGNNTPIVLFLVTAFAHEHLRSSDRSAGILLGAAIALKLWPLALIPLLIRDRRWQSLGFAAVVSGLVALVTLARLGPDVIGPAAEAMQAKAIIEPGNPVFYISWLRETQSWWPWWGTYVVATLLAAIPARGLLGIGLGIFAGLALVPNLWRTYVPTLLVGAAFVISAVYKSRNSDRGPAKSRHPASHHAAHPAEPDAHA